VSTNGSDPVSRAVHEVHPKFKTLPNHDVAYDTTNDIVVSESSSAAGVGRTMLGRRNIDHGSREGCSVWLHLRKVVLSALRRYDLSLRILRDDESHDSTVTAKRTRKSSLVFIYRQFSIHAPHTTRSFSHVLRLPHYKPQTFSTLVISP
jgi:hypothetical protein